MLIGIDASRAAIVRRTGTEAYSLHLIRAMLKRPDGGHQFRRYFHQPPAPHLVPAAPHIEQRVIPFPRLWTHLRLAVELTRRPVDWLLVPSHVLPLAFPGRAAVTVHDLGYRHFPQAHPAWSRLYLDGSTRWNLRRATLVIADSEATRRDIIAHYRADPAKIKVVYPGYDDALRPVTDPQQLAAVRQRYQIRGDYLLYLGTLQPRKNLLRLIEAFASLPVTHSVYQLVLAGQAGWLSEPMLERAKQAPNVLLPGFVADEDKAALLSGAAAFLFPSLYEGFGFPVLEAMACGVPVICSHTSSLPEVAGQAALLVDPEDVGAISAAIQRLLTEPALRDNLLERGFENLQRFSWDRCAGELLSAMEGMV